MRSALLIAGSVLLYGQVSPSPDAASAVQDLQRQVAAGVAARARVDQAQDALAAQRDAELLSAPVRLEDLTEERSAQLEQAALRQIERAKAKLERTRTMVNAGLVPAKSLEPLNEELASAQAAYNLTLSRTQLTHEAVEMARLEQQALELMAANPPVLPQESETLPVMERFDGDGHFTTADFDRVKSAFEHEFHKPLPVSAEGETAVHQALGFDHTGRVDVALLPDTAEGAWLRHFLEVSEIPYYAFRSEVPGKATGAHIHIGPPSVRLSALKRG